MPNIALAGRIFACENAIATPNAIADASCDDSADENPCLLVGRNSKGQWVVCDRSRLKVGLFRSLDAALRYARAETGGGARRLIITEAPLEIAFD